METFKNKYRIASARLQHWDYSWAGAYFITICTQNREHFFGEIMDGKMQLLHMGVIADILWNQIPHHTQNVELGEFVVMPNHIHGILILMQNDVNDPNIAGNRNDENNAENRNDDIVNVGTLDVETLHATSLRHPQQTNPPINDHMANISPKSNSDSTIIRSYKSAVTKHANRLGFQFQWQTRFHDHIIRDDKSFQKISNYIINNPANWQDDKFFKSE